MQLWLGLILVLGLISGVIYHHEYKAWRDKVILAVALFSYGASALSAYLLAIGYDL